MKNNARIVLLLSLLLCGCSSGNQIEKDTAISAMLKNEPETMQYKIWYEFSGDRSTTDWQPAVAEIDSAAGDSEYAVNYKTYSDRAGLETLQLIPKKLPEISFEETSE